ncbi:MAG: sigma-70 RNA polymerase sigma factor region 4 domain-containing protein, partial [Planctomycetota bacterium]
ASHYVRRDEQHEIRKEALASALQGLIDRLKDALNFHDLQIFELLFYSQLRNKDVARIMGLSAGRVAGVKHRWLEHLRRRLARTPGAAATEEDSDTLLTEVWESRRPSCPKRSTVGAYMLGTLEPAWAEHVDFHLHRLGCRFCLANLEDLKKQNEGLEREDLRARIMESTVGWLPRPQ